MAVAQFNLIRNLKSPKTFKPCDKRSQIFVSLELTENVIPFNDHQVQGLLKFPIETYPNKLLKLLTTLRLVVVIVVVSLTKKQRPLKKNSKSD